MWVKKVGFILMLLLAANSRAETPAQLEKRFKLRAVSRTSNTLPEMLMRLAQSSRAGCREAQLSSFSIMPAQIMRKVRTNEYEVILTLVRPTGNQHISALLYATRSAFPPGGSFKACVLGKYGTRKVQVGNGLNKSVVLFVEDPRS